MRKIFSRKMKCKWYSRDEPSLNFSEVPAWAKSNWKPPLGDPCLKLLFNNLESELFCFQRGKHRAYSLTKENWIDIGSILEDQSKIIKPADKGSCVVVWERVLPNWRI